jgi:hypothetical protein
MTLSGESDSLVQLVAREVTARTPSDHYSPPDFVELHLSENQRVVQIDWRRGLDSRRRKTVDWTATVWIEARL